MLKRTEKESIVKSLKQDIEGAKAIFFTNLIGVDCNNSVKIRKEIREANGKVVVTRNTLFKQAAQGTIAEKMLAEVKGPSALAFAFEDVPAVAKSLKNAGKEHEVVEFKGGIFDGEEISIDKIKELADLPSRDEMLGTMFATFNAPISAFARVMNQIIEQKESGQGSNTEETQTEEKES